MSSTALRIVKGSRESGFFLSSEYPPHLADYQRIANHFSGISVGFVGIVFENELIEPEIEIECPCAVEHNHIVGPKSGIFGFEYGLIVGTHGSVCK